MTSGGKPCVVVVGGGLTGLVAAYRLQQAGINVTLLEKTSRLGGCIRTVRQDGFVMEDGPDVFLARKPGARAICEELGLKLQEMLPQPRSAYILRNGVLHPLPEGFSGLVPARIGPVLRSPLLSLRGKLRFLMDLVVPPRRDEGDESVASFFTRRIGREAYAVFVEPLLGGISGGDPEELSLSATLPHLQVAERRCVSLLRATKRQPLRDSPFLSLEGGLETIAEAMALRLKDIRYETSVDTIGIMPGGGYEVHLAEGDALPAQGIVIATPAPAASAIVKCLDAKLAEELAAIPYSATITVQLAYSLGNVPRSLDGYGYIVSRQERRDAVACTWSSAKLSGRAPRDMVLLRLFLGCSSLDSVLRQSDIAVLARARSEVESTLGITAGPVIQRLHRWHHSMPQYNMDHPQRIVRIRDRLVAYPGLILCGAAFGGVGIPDRVNDGELAAENLGDYIR